MDPFVASSDPEAFIVLAFPFPHPTRKANNKLNKVAQQLGSEFSDGLALTYSYANVEVPAMEEYSDMGIPGQAMPYRSSKKIHQRLEVNVVNRRFTNVATKKIEMAMILCFHGGSRPAPPATLIWHDCPPLSSSTKLTEIIIQETIVGPACLHLYIKNSSLKPHVTPFLRVSGSSLVAKSIHSIPLHDITFLLYKRPNLHPGDTESIGILSANREVLTQITTHFDTYEEFGEADLTNPPDAMPSFDFGEWDDDSDLEDDPKPSPDQENHPVERSFSLMDLKSVKLTGLADTLRKISGERLIPIPDHAYKTWHAMVYYSYTGAVYFAPLSSDIRKNRRQVEEAHRSEHPDAPALVSCKSIYRLAEKYDITPLAELALDWFTAQLTNKVVMTELFQQHTEVYSQVKKVLLSYLLEHWIEMRHAMLTRFANFSPEEKLKYFWLVEAVLARSTVA